MPVFTFRAKLSIKNEGTEETFSIPVRAPEVHVYSEEELVKEAKDLLNTLITRIRKKAEFLLNEKILEKPEADIDQFVEGAS